MNLADPGGGLFTDTTVVATIAVSHDHRQGQDLVRLTRHHRRRASAVCGATLEVLPKAGAWTDCTAPTDVVEYPGLVRISLAADRLAQVLYDAEPECAGGGYASVLWSSPSGGTVLGAVSYIDDASEKNHPAIVLYRHGTVTRVNWPGAASLLLANLTAF